jgi:hypothetical protein
MLYLLSGPLNDVSLSDLRAQANEAVDASACHCERTPTDVSATTNPHIMRHSRIRRTGLSQITAPVPDAE